MIHDRKLMSIVIGNPVKVSYFILLVLALFSIFPVVPEIVKSFIAIPVLVFLPILFGNALICMIQKVWSKNMKDTFSHLGLIPSLIFEWFLGFYSIYALVFVFLLHTQNILLTLAVMVVICWIGAFRLDRERFTYNSTLINKRTTLLLLALIIVGLIPVSVIKYGTFPLPVSRAFTVGGHLYRYVYNIAEYGIPDTPYDVGHPASLNILYGLVSKMFSLDPLALLWSVSFLLLVLLSVGIFLFTYTFSGSQRLGLMASIIGVWILSGTNAAAYPAAPEAGYVMYALCPLIFYMFLSFGLMEEIKLRHVMYSIVLNLVFVLALRYIVSININWTANSPYLVVYQILILSYLLMVFLALCKNIIFALPFSIGLGAVAIHALYHGPLVLLVAATLLVFYRVNIRSNRRTMLPIIIQYSLIVFTFVYISLQLLDLIEIPVYNLISAFLGLKGGWEYTFDVKYDFLIMGAGEFALVLFFLGMLFLLLSKSKQDFTFATIATLVLLVYFLPEGWSYRAVDVLAPFLAYAVSSAIRKLVATTGGM